MMVSIMTHAISIAYTDAMQLRERLLIQALSYYGVRSLKGDRHSGIVRRMLRNVGFGNTDDLNWCSAFMSTIAKEVGAERSTSAVARSWSNVGREISRDAVLPGHVAVFRQPGSSWKGHVALFLRQKTPNVAYILGGNQRRQVCIVARKLDHLIGYRELSCEDDT